MKKNKFCLIWHEQKLFTNYFERLTSLSNYFEVSVITISHNKEIKKHLISNITIIELPYLFFKSISFFYLKYFYKTLYEIMPDIIYLHEEPYNPISFIGVYFAKKYHKKSIIDMAITSNKNTKLFALNEKYVINNVNQIYIRNNDVKKALKDRNHKLCLIEHKIKIMPNGINLNDFYKINKFQKEIFTLGYAGRIIENKGIITLLDFIKCNQNFKLRLVGDFEDNKFKKVVQYYIATNNLIDKVIIEKSKNVVELNQFYNEINFFILASIPTDDWTEQFGRVLTEAIAAGTVAIGTDIGFIPNIVLPKQTFKPNNIKELFSIINLLLEKNYYEKILKLQYDNIKQFSWEKIALIIFKDIQ